MCVCERESEGALVCSSVESTQVVALFRSDAFSVVRMVCVCV